MNGFKSFGKETEIPFNNSLNTVVGVNGSGKSNISDAICFVLGRLSAKSMRAKKTTGMIFLGTKSMKPSHEARVDIVFDNSDRSFSFDVSEVKISRIAKKDGQSDYKLNDKSITRQQILDVLAQAGIDPYGFNIVLQNEISRFVEMNGEERRQIIEEVAGISVYEIRKQQSLKELEKTEQKLVEAAAALKERTLYMKNLEEERANALKYQETENLLKREKASLVYKNIKEKKGEKDKVETQILKEQEVITKEREKIEKKSHELRDLNNEAEVINKKIQEATGFEQETLYKHLSSHKEAISALNVRIENFKIQVDNTNERNEQLKKQIEEGKSKVEELKKKVPEQEKLKRVLKEKALSFSEIQNKYEKLMRLKSEKEYLGSFYSQNESSFARLNKQIIEQEKKLSVLRDEIKEFQHEIKEIDKLKSRISDSYSKLSNYQKEHVSSASEIAKIEREIELLQQLKKEIQEIEICPTCRRKISAQEKKSISSKAENDISKLDHQRKESRKYIDKIISDVEEMRKEINLLEERHRNIHAAKTSFETIKEREEFLDGLKEERKLLSDDMKITEKKLNETNALINEFKEYELQYKEAKDEIQRLSKEEKDKENLQLDINMTEREIQNSLVLIKRNNKEIEGMELQIDDFERQLEDTKIEMEGTEKAEQEMKKRFQSMMDKRNKLQESARKIEQENIELQVNLRHREENINSQKITIAKIDAEHSIFISEFEQYGQVDIIESSRNELQSRIAKHEKDLQELGTVNLKALVVYAGLKEEYDKINEKVEVIVKEKDEIMKIIEEIDKKKKISFMKTLKIINEAFSANFTRVSNKGFVLLELENPEDPFAGGLEISLKQGKGKFFDVHSLSGGEQTLLAISLIFSIQEYKPYPFYILDEIDAALDKLNSEKLGALLAKYTNKAQYIVITHNDAVISQSQTLYGITMQDGISQVVSLRLNEK